MKSQEEIILKRKHLLDVSKKLKEDFVGLDSIIDRLIRHVEIWYLYPNIVHRPVIVNLWGLTGVGKTDLIRKFTQYLNFSDRYLEIPLDCFSDSGTKEYSSIQDALLNSNVDENEQGVLVLDEFQRFRTLNNDGDDVDAPSCRDVWELLSDGSFSNNFDRKKMANEFLLELLYDKERGNDDDDDVLVFDESPKKKKKNKNYKFKTNSWRAEKVKKFLRIPESIEIIMTWERDYIIKRFEDGLKDLNINRGSNYKKLLIVICGNLDEVYEIANEVENADTDADIFHEITSKITIVDIKRSLMKRFKPEQISRLGNNHIIYPSLSKNAFHKLIDKRVKNNCELFKKEIGVDVTFSEQMNQIIYNNSVYPSQGVRPLFSAIDNIFNAIPEFLVNDSFSKVKKSFIVDYCEKDLAIKFKIKPNIELFSISYKFELDSIKNEYDSNFKALIAVHETGHALSNVLLFKTVPKQIKSSVTSFEGGYVITEEVSGSKDSLNKEIQRCLAGRVAEEIVFGEGYESAGGYSDFVHATKIATSMVRKYGMDSYWGIGCIDSELSDMATDKLTYLNDTNEAISTIIKQNHEHIKDLLSKNLKLLIEVSEYLMENSEITPIQFKEICMKQLSFEPKIIDDLAKVYYDDYSEKFKQFKDLIFG